MKNILVPTDFSIQSEWALIAATEIAKRSNGAITLLHVIEEPEGYSFNVEGEVNRTDTNENNLFMIKLIEQAKAKLAKACDDVLVRGVQAKFEILVGRPFQTIRAKIDEGVDLVVMGNTGHSKAEEIFVGSTTDRTVRHAKCPVLTVHQKPSTSEFKNIVYATSMNESEKEFAQVVKNTQQMYDARVHVVRVNTPLNFKPDYVTEILMKNFITKMNIQNYTVNTCSDLTEEEGIVHFASSIKADLIAMATHGRKGVAHILLGSIAEGVVNHSSKPVLTYVVPD